MDWEFGISRLKLLYAGRINNKVLLKSTGNYIQCPVINRNGKVMLKKVYICTTESLYCTHKLTQHHKSTILEKNKIKKNLPVCHWPTGQIWTASQTREDSFPHWSNIYAESTMRHCFSFHLLDCALLGMLFLLFIFIPLLLSKQDLKHSWPINICWTKCDLIFPVGLKMWVSASDGAATLIL